MMDLYHLVRAVNPSVLLVTELHVDAACSFLSPLDPLMAAGRDDPAFLTPAFMAGQVLLVQLVHYMALQVCAWWAPGSTGCMVHNTIKLPAPALITATTYHP
jgi:hypothetical protein